MANDGGGNNGGGFDLMRLLDEVRRLEASGVVLPGKMRDGSPSIAAQISWVVGQMALSRNTVQAEMGALEETVRATVYKRVEDELCALRALRDNALTDDEKHELLTFLIDFETNPFARGEVAAMGGIRAVLSDETLQKIGFLLDMPAPPLVLLSRAQKAARAKKPPTE